jgi:hypothetical protein
MNKQAKEQSNASKQEIADAKTWASTCNDIEALREAYSRSLELLENTLDNLEKTLTSANLRVY